MTLEQLRIFVAVAERQHVTRAAEALNLAQSAASNAVAALEAQHGVKLFHRVGRGIELTEPGAAFLAEARAVLARAAKAALLLDEFAGLQRGTLAVQASQTIASYWLPRHLVAFRHHYPHIELHVSIGNTAQVAASVREGAVELGFVEGVVDDPGLQADVVARDQLVLVVGASHPWAGRDEVTFDELGSTEWVLREPGSGTRSAFEAARHGADRAGGGVDRTTALPVAMELPSNEAVRAAVEAGAGATVISASVAAPGLEAGLLHRIGLDLPDRAFEVLRHRDRAISRVAEAFLHVVARSVPSRAAHCRASVSS